MIKKDFNTYIKIYEMNFFKFVFLVYKSEKDKKNNIFDVYEIIYEFDFKEFLIKTSLKVDKFGLTKFLNNFQLKKMFNLLRYHSNTLKVFYLLQNPDQNKFSIGQRIISGKPYFLFYQITEISWELAIIPFNKVFKKNKIFSNLFPILKFKINIESTSLFIFFEEPNEDLINEFYEIYKEFLNLSIFIKKNIIIVSNYNFKNLFDFILVIISFILTKINLKICVKFVRINRLKIDMRLLVNLKLK